MATLVSLQKEGRDRTIADLTKMSKIMENEYRKALIDINKDISKAYSTLGNVPATKYYTELTKIGRLKSLLTDVEKKYIFYARKASEAIRQNSKIALNNNFYRQLYALSWYTPISPSGITLSFTMIDPIAVELAVFGLDTRWKNLEDVNRKKALLGYVPKGSKPTLTSIINNNQKKGLNRIKDTITQGLIQGHSYNKMELSIRHVFNMDKNVATRVMRTEGNQLMNAASYATTQSARNDGVSLNRKLLSVIDGKTRSQSSQVDDQYEELLGYFVYPGGKQVYYPGSSGVAKWDINDRESTIDIIPGLEPELRRGKNPHTGKTEVSSYNDFNTWAKKHDVVKNDYGQYYNTKAHKYHTS